MVKIRYQNGQKQAAYLNACDCLRYGYNRSCWNSCGLTGEDANQIWVCAFRDVAEAF